VGRKVSVLVCKRERFAPPPRCWPLALCVTPDVPAPASAGRSYLLLLPAAAAAGAAIVALELPPTPAPPLERAQHGAARRAEEYGSGAQATALQRAFGESRLPLLRA